MLRLWTDGLRSVCAGAGLVLLLAAEGNVCPHLLNPLAEPASRPTDSPAGTLPEATATGGDTAAQPFEPVSPAAPSDSEPGDPASSEKPEPLAWSAAWPDAMPARRPWYMDRAAQVELAGRRSGTVACGPLDQRPAPQLSAYGDFTPPWADRFPQPLLVAIPADSEARPVRNPALATLLMRTGPPC